MTITDGLKIKKIKSPVKSPKSSNNKSNKSYEKFLKGSNENTNVSKDKKVIKVQRKRNSPQRVSTKRNSKNIQDINDIERNMLMMKNNNIKVPTQNKGITNENKLSNKIVKPKPVLETKPVVETKPAVKPKKSRITRSPKRVRISDIDVREKRDDETLTELKQKEKKRPTLKTPEVEKPVENKVKTKPISQSNPLNKPNSLTRATGETRSTTRPINRIKNNRSKNNRSKTNRSKTNRKISIQNKKLGEKDIQNVSQKMRQIRNTKTDEIKKELEKQGVKVSGKSDRLLKDIYLYSKVCNINITHEK